MDANDDLGNQPVFVEDIHGSQEQRTQRLQDEVDTLKNEMDMMKMKMELQQMDLDTREESDIPGDTSRSGIESSTALEEDKLSIEKKIEEMTKELENKNTGIALLEKKLADMSSRYDEVTKRENELGEQRIVEKGEFERQLNDSEKVLLERDVKVANLFSQVAMYENNSTESKKREDALLSENNGLLKKCDQMEDRVQEITETNVTLRDTSGLQSNKVGGLENEVCLLKDEILKLCEKLEASEAVVVVKESKISSLTERNSELTNVRRVLEVKYESKRQEMKELEGTLSICQTKVDSFMTQMSDFQVELKTKMNRITQQDEATKRLKVEKTNVEKDLTESNNSYDELFMKFGDQENKMVEQCKEIVRLKNNVENVRIQYSEATTKCEEMSKDMEETIGLRHRVVELENDYKQVAQEKEDIERDKMEKSSEISRLTSDIELINTKYREVSSLVDDVKGFQNTIDGLVAGQSELQQGNSDFKEELLEKSTKIAQLQLDAEHLQARYSEVQTQLEEKCKIIDHTERTIAVLTGEQAEITGLYDVLNVSCREQSTENTKLQNELDNMEVQHNDLKLQLLENCSERNTITNMETQVIELLNVQTEQEQSKKDLEAELDYVKSELEKSQEQLIASKNQSDELKKVLEEKERDNEKNVNDKLNDTLAMIEHKQSTIDVLQNEYDICLEKVQAEEKKCANVEVSVRYNEMVINRLQDECNNILKPEVCELSDALCKSKEALSCCEIGLEQAWTVINEHRVAEKESLLKIKNGEVVIVKQKNTIESLEHQLDSMSARINEQDEQYKKQLENVDVGLKYQQMVLEGKVAILNQDALSIHPYEDRVIDPDETLSNSIGVCNTDLMSSAIDISGAISVDYQMTYGPSDSQAPILADVDAIPATAVKESENNTSYTNLEIYEQVKSHNCEMDVQVYKLQAELTSLNETMSESNEVVGRLRQQIAAQEASLSEKESLIEQHSHALENLRAELQLCKDREVNKHHEVDKFNCKLDLMQNQVALLSEQRNNFESKVELITQQRSECEEKLEHLAQEKNELANRLELVTEQRNELSVDLLEAQDELHVILEKHSSEMDKKSQMYEKAQQEMGALSNAVSEKDVLQSNLDLLKTDLMTAQEKLKSIVDLKLEVEASVVSRDSLIEELKMEITCLHSENTNLKECTSKENDDTSDDIGVSITKLSDTKSENYELSEQVSKLQARCAVYDNEILKLTSDIEKISNQNSAYEENELLMKVKNSEVQNEISTVQGKLEKLEQDSSSFTQDLNIEISTLNTEIEELRHMLCEQRKQNGELREGVSESEKKISQIQNDCEELKSENLLLHSQLTEFQDNVIKVNDSKAELEQKEEEMVKLTCETAVKDEQLRLLEQEIQTLKTESKHLNVRVAGDEKQIGDLSDKLEESQNACEKIQHVHSQVSDENMSFKSLMNEQRKCIEKVPEIEHELVTAREANKALAHDVKVKEEQTQNFELENQTLKAELTASTELTQKAIKDKESSDKLCGDSKCELVESENDRLQIQKELELMGTDNISLKCRITEMQNSLDSLENVREQLFKIQEVKTALDRDFALKDEQVKSFELDIQAIRTALDEEKGSLSQSQLLVVSLQQELNTKGITNDAETLKAQHDLQVEEVKNLLNEKLENLMIQMGAREVEVAMMVQSHKDSENELREQHKQKYHKLVEQFNGLKKEIKAAVPNVADSMREAELMELQADHASLRGKLHLSLTNARRLEKELAVVQAAAQQLERLQVSQGGGGPGVSRLESELSEARAESEEYLTKYSDYKHHHDLLVSQNDLLKSRSIVLGKMLQEARDSLEEYKKTSTDPQSHTISPPSADNSGPARAGKHFVCDENRAAEPLMKAGDSVMTDVNDIVPTQLGIVEDGAVPTQPGTSGDSVRRRVDEPTGVMSHEVLKSEGLTSDVLKSDVLKSDVLKSDVLKSDGPTSVEPTFEMPTSGVVDGTHGGHVKGVSRSIVTLDDSVMFDAQDDLKQTRLGRMAGCALRSAHKVDSSVLGLEASAKSFRSMRSSVAVGGESQRGKYMSVPEQLSSPDLTDSPSLSDFDDIQLVENSFIFEGHAADEKEKAGEKQKQESVKAYECDRDPARVENAISVGRDDRGGVQVVVKETVNEPMNSTNGETPLDPKNSMENETPRDVDSAESETVPGAEKALEFESLVDARISLETETVSDAKNSLANENVPDVNNLIENESSVTEARASVRSRLASPNRLKLSRSIKRPTTSSSTTNLMSVLTEANMLHVPEKENCVDGETNKRKSLTNDSTAAKKPKISGIPMKTVVSKLPTRKGTSSALPRPPIRRPVSQLPKPSSISSSISALPKPKALGTVTHDVVPPKNMSLVKSPDKMKPRQHNRDECKQQ